MQPHAHQRPVAERAQQQAVPCEARRPPPRRAHAVDKALRNVRLVAHQILHPADARRVLESRARDRTGGALAEQPRRRDESHRRQPRPLEFLPRPRHPLVGFRLFHVIKFSLARRVGFRHQPAPRPIRLPPLALMIIPMHDRLAPCGGARAEPPAKIGVLQEMPSVMVIGDHQKRHPLHSKPRQISQHGLRGRPRARADVVNRDHQPPGLRRFFWLPYLHS